MALQSSQRLPELLFYTKKSYKILQPQFQLQFQLQFYTCTLHYNPENSPSRIQFYIQKTKSSLGTTTTYRGQRTFIPERNSTHRRQGDLLEMHPCVLHDIPVTPVTPVTPTTPETFQTFQSFMTFQPFSLSRQFYNAPVSPGNPPHSSILRLECIFYSSIGFHRNSTEYQLNNYKHYILQRKGDVAISVKRASVKDVKMTYFLE